MPSTFRCSPKARNSFSTRAHVQRSPATFFTTRRSERVIRVEENRDWAFIDQLHGHHRLKNSSGDSDAQLAQRLTKFVIECFCEFRLGRGDEARPPLPARVAVQRKLRNGQGAAFD